MDFKEIEKKWQKYWEEHPELSQANNNDHKKKFYILVEFPYPSGAGLHVGHVRSWAAMDIYARKKRMEGYNVLFPMGWDAFGLPAENYAIKMGVHPSKIVPQNVAKFKEQCKAVGLSFDWSREVDTTDPKYYKWTQWIFLQLVKKGLAHRIETQVNWCPFCKTTLANEEVGADGMHERCGKPTEKKTQKQWVIKITQYADRLIDDLKLVDFSSNIAAQQVKWIGKSEGAKIRFKIKDRRETLEVFTTRPDTLYGATFMVIAPEHKLVSQLVETHHDASLQKDIKAYVANAQKKSDLERTELNKDKTGVFSGLYAINPISNKEIPIWISDFVLAAYGTGAIMSVPAHDERDFEFAQKFNLPIWPVIRQSHGLARSYLMGATKISDIDLLDLGIKIVGETDKGNRKIEIPSSKLGEYEKLINEKLDNGFWNEYIGEEVVFIFKNEAGEIKRIVLNEETEAEIDKMACEYNGNDWTQKQSVWAWLAENEWYRDYIFTTDVNDGIMINSPNWNGIKPSEAIKSAIELIKERGIGERANNYHLRDWVFSRQHYWGEPIPIVHCDKCGEVPVPESELPVELPYVERYEPSGTGESPLANISEWVNTSCPKCGGAARRETDTMPNWAGSNWYFLRYLDADNNDELASREKMDQWMPVDIYQGGFEHTTLHLLYSRFIYKFLYDIGVVPGLEPYAKRRSHGIVLGADGNKMSKSFGNVINPDEVIEKYGADTLRIYEMFMGPFDQMVAWSDESASGCQRFLLKTIKLFEEQVGEGEENVELLRKLHQTITKVSSDIENLKFNTAVAAMMELVNLWQQSKSKLTKNEATKFLKVLAVFAPYTTEELWSKLGETGSVHAASWPVADPKHLVEDEVVIPVAVNGRVRDQLSVNSEQLQNKEEIIGRAKNLEKVAKWLEGKEIRKEIYVPGKMVNLVVK